MASRRTIALLGATGHLGHEVAKALVASTFRSSYANVLLLTRKPSDALNSFAPGSAQVRQFTAGNLSEALEGVDVLISTIGPTGHDFKDSLIDAMANSNVQLYIPSEFGVDHTVHDFSQPEWDHKKKHDLKVRARLQKTKVCRVYNGLFLEDSIGPWFGMDIKHRTFESIGTADVAISFTALGDVGNVVAQLARMPYEEIPQQLHISGDTLTMRQVAKAMEAAGSSPLTMREVDPHSYKKAAVEENSADPMKYLRFLMGEGRINHTTSGLGIENELVNPEQRIWKWKTVVQYAEEVKGQPWVDFPWPAEKT